MTAPAVVAVVGGGASGTLTAAHLARWATIAGRSIHLVLVEPDSLGQGLAYSTTDPRHRLNVPASGMSAWPEDPSHFLRWLRRHVAIDFPAAGFAPRMQYALYLDQVLDQALRDAVGVSVEHLKTRATDVRRHGRRLRLTLADGTSRPVDSAVLALGHGSPSTSWAPPELRRSPRFVADPWRLEQPLNLHSGDDVVLVGAGLTMADMALRYGREGVRVHVVSRHGLLPLPHAATPLPATPLADPAAVDGVDGLASARRLVFTHLRAVRDAGGDWRQGIDGLRPLISALWRQLDDPARGAFLASASRRWDRVRHRVDPALHSWLQERRTEGSLVSHAAEVVAAAEIGGRLRVQLSDGSVVDAAAVLNCTGTCVGVQASDDPLIMNLLAGGVVRPGPLDLGFATDTDGRISASEAFSVWAVGPLRRGELWESTAVPELRSQAAEVARAVIEDLPALPIARRPRDQYGLPITANGAAAERYLAGLGRILRVQSGAETLIAQAVALDPDFALGHAVQALLGVEWGAEVDVETSLAKAHRAMGRADERERRFIEVATARVQEPGAGSAAALLSYLNAYPEDALAVSLAVPTIAFGGATEIPAEAWALVEGLQPAYGQNWWWLGMLAFVRQDQSRFDEAAELSAQALAVEPAAGHAVHAKTHAHYETGDHVAGLAWLDRWIATSGAAASHRAHFAWHAALHELALGDDAAAHARFAAQLAPPEVSGVRALVDSASLLWRGYTLGAWERPEIAPVLATVPEGLLYDPPTPFVALHAAVALAAAGDCQGLARLRRAAAARSEPAFTDTVAPLADALVHLLLGDADRATDGLTALCGVDRLGGSAAQREIVEDTLLFCATKARRFDQAQVILHGRLERRRSPRDAARCQQLNSTEKH
ncbi:FAD/NAD(P)-binding protein [Jatrophihabitans sp.]|uniref:FAD/NAD(P)-binding protein n=1 Tax=Jatrophihabitans sp. TaxID=1932789 RepID=UPI0030C727F9|nr:FAD-dependent pyridine nucleotide-disulfide oxidoreductase [Jatrophihabitans sp.]